MIVALNTAFMTLVMDGEYGAVHDAATALRGLVLGYTMETDT